MTELVGDVVELARAPGQDAIARQDVALDELTRDAIERAQRRARDMRFAEDLQPSLVHADAQRLGRAISNMLDNACKWSPPGGHDRGEGRRRPRHGPRPRPRLPRRRPRQGLRPLLARGRGARQARLRPRPGDRAAGRRGARRQRREPRTPRTAAPWSASSCRRSTRPNRSERQLELEAGVRVGQLIAEELAQPAEPVADRLRVEVERAGHRGRVAAVLDEGEGRLLHPRLCRPA